MGTGAALEVVGKDGTFLPSPLAVAVLGGHVSVLRAFLDSKDDVNMVCSDGATLLLIAAKRGHLEIVKCLLAAGGDPGLADDAGLTPLVAAATDGRMDIVSCLLEAGAEKDQAMASDGSTALTAAAFNGHLAVVKCLVESGADLSLPRKDGLTPLRLAAQKEEWEVFGFLQKPLLLRTYRYLSKDKGKSHKNG